MPRARTLARTGLALTVAAGTLAVLTATAPAQAASTSNIYSDTRCRQTGLCSYVDNLGQTTINVVCESGATQAIAPGRSSTCRDVNYVVLGNRVRLIENAGIVGQTTFTGPGRVYLSDYEGGFSRYAG